MNETSDPSRPDLAEREPYEKPSILWEEVIDVRRTLAVACAKVSGRAGLCNAAPTS